MFFTAFAKLVAALNANRREGEIAGAVVLGIALALVPVGNLVWVALFLITFTIKVNLGIALVVFGVFTPVGLLVDPWLDQLGFALLSTDAAYEFLATSYNAPLGPFLGIHNTSVAGGLIVSAVLSVPIYMLARLLVRYYRNTVRQKIADSRIVQWYQRLPLAALIRKLVERAKSMYELASF
ncbi:MAG: TIGR03546 family protein [Spirochaetia bacterium]